MSALPLARRLAVVLFFVALAGCSHAVGVAAGGGSSGRVNAWTKPGILRIVNIVEPDTLNPLLGNSQIDSDLANFWGGMLLNWNDGNAFVPELATAVPTLENGGISKDNRTVTYHLRPGVLWHDGKPFTADDVIFTWHAILNPKNNIASTVGYDVVAGIEKRDAHTIVVRLKYAWAPFVATFFAPSGNPYPILPAHLLARYPDINRVAYNSAPVGTGPFTVERWQRGSKIVFKANEHYWRGPPKLKEIWYSPIPNENTIITLLQSHEADLEYNGSQRNVAQFRSIPGFVTTFTPFTQYAMLALNNRSPALSDVRVRRALWYAFDTRTILHDVTHDVDVAGQTDQPDFLWAHNSSVTRYTYDPARARALLDAAGWKVGSDGIRSKNSARLSLTMAGIAGEATGEATAIVVQANFKAIGVELLQKSYSSSLYFASYATGGIVQGGKFDIAFYSWLNGVDPDDSVQFMCDQFPPKGQNAFRYCNPELDRNERIALGTNDRVTRKKAYDEIQRILARDVPAIVAYYVRRISVHNVDLKRYRPAHAVTSFWNPYEWSI